MKSWRCSVLCSFLPKTGTSTKVGHHTEASAPENLPDTRSEVSAKLKLSQSSTLRRDTLYLIIVLTFGRLTVSQWSLVDTWLALVYTLYSVQCRANLLVMNFHLGEICQPFRTRKWNRKLFAKTAWVNESFTSVRNFVIATVGLIWGSQKETLSLHVLAIRCRIGQEDGRKHVNTTCLNQLPWWPSIGLAEACHAAASVTKNLLDTGFHVSGKLQLFSSQHCTLRMVLSRWSLLDTWMCALCLGLVIDVNWIAARMPHQLARLARHWIRANVCSSSIAKVVQCSAQSRSEPDEATWSLVVTGFVEAITQQH